MVVSSALEMPGAASDELAEPCLAICSNDTEMPHTVPNKPSIGAMV